MCSMTAVRNDLGRRRWWLKNILEKKIRNLNGGGRHSSSSQRMSIKIGCSLCKLTWRSRLAVPFKNVLPPLRNCRSSANNSSLPIWVSPRSWNFEPTISKLQVPWTTPRWTMRALLPFSSNAKKRRNGARITEQTNLSREWFWARRSKVCHCRSLGNINICENFCARSDLCKYLRK